MVRFKKKMNNGKIVRISGLILAAIVILAGIVGTFAVNADDIGEIKAEGCLPARDNKNAIIAIQKSLEHIQKDTEAILKKLE